jgi:hypothetical protein
MYNIVLVAKIEAEENGILHPDDHRPLHDLFEIQRLLLEAGFDPQQELAKDCCTSWDFAIMAGTYVCCCKHATLSTILTRATGCVEMLS